ncbi:MAG TPA: HAMP domain-containing sensor histidine kinase [Candidatus Gastranaerophilaceae bacterium]|nr:HAMP domain-containing sensor histidine kinase [Candidatus Gastranaerophilaceae bacterium]
MKKLKLHRLKIAEQILVVLLFAVIIPMAISGFIINNINQQSIRSQLRDSAMLIAKMVSQEVDIFITSSLNELNQIKFAADYMGGTYSKPKYFNKVLKNSPEFQNLEILNTKQDLLKLHENNLKNNNVSIYTTMRDNKFLVATFNVDFVKKSLFKPVLEDERQIYVLSSNGTLIAAHNFKEKDYQNTMKYLPKKLKTDTPVIFGKTKNQPLVYYKKTSPNIMIVVNTTKGVMKKTINANRFKIILAVLIAALTVIFVVGLYTYYLYINIRQLFKGIIAISKGNYQRRIRLLTNVFTPYEIVFLAFEFNRMASQIHKSYIQLKKKNVELKDLNEFRSNLVDTVSHEFRTPLTSIQGYTSRLLRQDIEIDEDTKQKSLKTIKKQSERLSRMVEDLLVVPDIEGLKLRIQIEPVWLSKTINSAITLVKSDEIKIVNKVSDDFPLVLADKDRFEQVLVNLLENAVKYSQEKKEVTVESKIFKKYAKIYVKNDCKVIPKDKLNVLFEKFTRIDDKTTRTTRGTGLGLYIVKGLVEAMNGEIKLSSTKEKGFVVEIKLPIFNPEKVK